MQTELAYLASLSNVFDYKKTSPIIITKTKNNKTKNNKTKNNKTKNNKAKTTKTNKTTKNRKVRLKCEHGNYREFCVDCRDSFQGGQGLCDDHSKNKYRCVKCKVNGRKYVTQVCDHLVAKATCVKCKKSRKGGKSLCDHFKNRHKVFCEKCDKEGVYLTEKPKTFECEHGKNKRNCSICKIAGVGGGNLCDEHHNHRRTCRECKISGIGGNDLCNEHHKLRRTCKKCFELGIGGIDICNEHHNLRRNCKECKKMGIGGNDLCDVHHIRKRNCKICNGFSTYKSPKNKVSRSTRKSSRKRKPVDYFEVETKYARFSW